MSVSSDMIAMWHKPMAVLRRQFAAGQREDRAIALLMGANLLVFVGQLPRLQREAIMSGNDELFLQQATYTFAGWMMIAPLLMYGLAALTYLLMKLIRAQVSPYGSRLALFWAHLCAAPVLMLYGLSMGFVGPTAAVTVVGVLWVASFLIFWTLGLRVAGQEVSHA